MPNTGIRKARRPRVKQLAEERNAAERYAADPTTRWLTRTTVDGLIAGIVVQCEERLEAHQQRKVDDFTKDEVFQALVKEMLNVKTMARCKFLHWLDDDSQYLAVIEGAQLGLRDAIRGYISLLKMKLAGAACEGRRGAALEVLKLRGVVEARVHDEDADGETTLVRAAADGLSAEDLRLLIVAGAKVNEPTKNGFIPLRHAAGFSQLEAALLLIESKAELEAATEVRNWNCPHRPAASALVFRASPVSLSKV